MWKGYGVLREHRDGTVTYYATFYNSIRDVYTRIGAPTEEEMEIRAADYEQRQNPLVTFRVAPFRNDDVTYRTRSGRVILRREEDAEGVWVCCQYPLDDGTVLTLRGRTVEEVRVRISMALDDYRAAHPELLETQRRLFQAIRARFEKLSPAQQEHVQELLMVAAFGSTADRAIARKELQTLSGVRNESKRVELLDRRKQQIRAMDASVPQFSKTQYTVSEYLNEYIEERGVTTLTHLADLVGCGKATISRIKNGETTTYKRERMLRIGVALQLPKTDLRQFMAAANFDFPLTATDRLIEKLLDQGVTDYEKIRARIINNGLQKDF